jgi:aminoglycoside phosphotransferase
MSDSDSQEPESGGASELARQPDPIESESLAEWLCLSLGPGSSILSSLPLIGGIAGDATRLRVRDGKGGIRYLVLHCFNDYGGREATIEALRNEVAVHHLLDECSHAIGVTTPKVIAVDYEGTVLQKPLLLCSWLPGQVIVSTSDPRKWAEDLAQPLPLFHALNTDSTTIVRDKVGRRKTPQSFPEWSHEKSAWQAVIDTAQEGIPDGEPVFKHGDYHPTNVIWQNGAITGIIDWSLSSIGPVGLDLSHTRINLVSMYGLETADCFLEAYRKIGRAETRDDVLQARCDAVRCWLHPFRYPPWSKLGLHLTDKIIQERLDAYAVNIASRLE